MRLIDLHAHSSGISRCCKLPGDKILDTAKAYGYGGIALSNHFEKNYIDSDGYDAFVDRYMAEYESVKTYGDTIGLTVFFAVELTLEFNRCVHMLLYGADSTFLHAQKNLYELLPDELYRVCHDHGIFVVQAHPYRNGTHPLPTDCVDGYEINCHPIYKKTYSGQLLAYQRENGMVLTCGCDYHGDSERVHGGVLLPDDITTEDALVHYLRTTPCMELQVQEVGADTVQRYSVPVRR